MKYNPDIHRRRSVRLKGYDYSQNGAYFVTICTQNKECLFGEIIGGKMVLNDAGLIIEKWWLELENKFSNFKLDAFVVMPNHFHAIVVIESDNLSQQTVGVVPCVYPNAEENFDDFGVQKTSVGLQNETAWEITPASGQAQGIAPTNNPQNKKTTVGDIIGAFKSLTTHEYIQNVKLGKFPEFDRHVWQRNYHEHIIRDEKSYEMIHEYILHNAERWEDDGFFVE